MTVAKENILRWLDNAATLPDRLRTDRLRRKLTWPAYADLLGVKLSTLNKMVRGVHKPSQLTVVQIEERLEALAKRNAKGDQTAAVAVPE